MCGRVPECHLTTAAPIPRRHLSWKRAKESLEIEDKRKVYAFSERGGWVYATRGRTNGRPLYHGPDRLSLGPGEGWAGHL